MLATLAMHCCSSAGLFSSSPWALQCSSGSTSTSRSCFEHLPPSRFFKSRESSLDSENTSPLRHAERASFLRVFVRGCHGMSWTFLLQNVFMLFLWTPDNQRQAHHASTVMCFMRAGDTVEGKEHSCASYMTIYENMWCGMRVSV